MSDIRIINKRDEQPEEPEKNDCDEGCGGCNGGGCCGGIPNSGFVGEDLEFKPGDIVESVLTNKKMMVVLVGVDRFDYLVRTSEYELVPMFKFEVKRWEA